MMRIAQEDAKNYLLAGDALLNAVNTQNGHAYAFVIRQRRNRVTKERENLWWIENNQYVMIGYIEKDVFKTPRSERVTKLYEPQQKAFAYTWKRIIEQNVPDFIHLYRGVECGHCGRPLTDEYSMKVGIGPVCRKKLGINETKDATAHG